MKQNRNRVTANRPLRAANRVSATQPSARLRRKNAKPLPPPLATCYMIDDSRKMAWKNSAAGIPLRCRLGEQGNTMRAFLAGIMQGSQSEDVLHNQDYREQLKRLLEEHLPTCQVYDPLDNHRDSLSYDHQTGQEVFLHHNSLCREVDLLVAYVPEASMGTAIEMWEAYRHQKIVLTISPLVNNWVIKYCSHQIFPDVESLAADLSSGQLQKRIVEWRS